MGYSWQLKPKDSMVVPIQQYSPVGIQNITIGRVKELITAKGFNAAILVWQTRSGYSGYMIMTNFGNVSADLDLATDVYFNRSDKTLGYSVPQSRKVEQTWMWYIYRDGNGIANQTGSVWNTFATQNVVDDVSYYVINNPSSEHPPIYVTTYEGTINYHGNVPIEADWESVNYLQGRDKTYLLTRIFNINDGDPVSNVTPQGNFSLGTKTAVNVLIDEILMDWSKVKVTYSIPEDTYNYIKLVYKKDSIPVDKDDGTAIDILQTDTESVITGITDGSTYWFMIFTNLGASDPVSIKTVEVNNGA